MAEGPNQRFYCHTCRMELYNISANFTCPRCDNGFVEEITPEPSSESLNNSSSSRAEIDPPNTPGEGPSFGPGVDLRSLASHILHNVMGNNNANIENRDPGMLYLGNLRDVSLGYQNFDHLLTQLLNSADANGVPPLPKEKIAAIPKSSITADDVAKKTQCTVCLDEFDLNDVVCKLPCSHTYHERCIVTWLGLHGNCPVCRKALASDDSASDERPSTSASAPRITNTNPFRTAEEEVEVIEIEDSDIELD